MSDNDTTTGSNNVFPFPRIGFTLTPTPTVPGPDIPPPPATPPTTPAPPSLPRGASGRLSPLDALTCLPDPGVTAPVITPTTPGPGQVPDTFRSEPAPDMVGPRLGALSLAAILAVAVAALRGSHTVMSTWWENRQAKQADTDKLREARLKHQLAMQGIHDKADQQRAKTSRKVPSSSQFGSKTLSGRSGPGSGSGSGSGRGRSGGSAGSGSKKPRGNGGLKDGRGGPKKSGGLFGGGSRAGGSGAGGTGKGGGRGLKDGPKKSPKGPHRTSQGAGSGLKKRNGKGTGGGTAGKDTTGNGGKGTRSGRTTLPQALKNTAQKTADRRLKRRRKNLNNPALWGNGGKPGGKNKQLPNGNGKANGSGKGKANGQAGGNTKPANPNKKQTPGRVTLAHALRNAALKGARKRLKQRRRNPATPPIWGAGGNNNQKPAGGQAAPQGAKNAGGPKAGQAGPRQHGKTNRNRPGARKYAAWWAKARANANKKSANGGCFPGPGSAGKAGQYGGRQGAKPGPGGYAPPNGAGHRPGARKSPFQNAGQAAGNAAPQYKVQRADYPGAQAKKWEPAAITEGTPALPSTGPAALDTAPTTNPPRPGTSRPRSPIPMPKARREPDAMVAKHHKDAARTATRTVGRRMDAQHATEITLDDACDAAEKLSDDAFKTHDQAHKLAQKARSLRDAWLILAQDCATNHNLIGDLFTTASIRFAESMELVARMSEEMEASSLQAAETAETAGNEINDAYRPISQATADAGLTTPSAPAHNRV